VRAFVVTLVVIALGVLVGAPVAGASGGLLGDVTAPLTDPDQGSEQAP
jgi:hypothetical protein